MNDDIIKIDTTGQTCPMPLLAVRRTILNGKKGDIVEVTGDHLNSRHEIPIALESMNCEILEEKEENGRWIIRFRI